MAYVDRDAASYFARSAGGSDDQDQRAAYAAHMDLIASYVVAWQRGEITLDAKRRAISDENRAFYGPDCPKHLLWRA